jgi:hypothetical protein
MAAFAQLLLCVLAMACLALAMARHQAAVFGKGLSRAASRGLRGAGWAGLIAALWLTVAARGWSLGLVYYSGCASLAAGIVFCALIAHERRST